MEPSKHGALEIEESGAELSKLRRRCLNPYAKKHKKPGSIGTKIMCINEVILLIFQVFLFNDMSKPYVFKKSKLSSPERIL